MVYECDKCERPLGAGMLFCPYCGEKFPNPVPGDPANTPADTVEYAPISQAASEVGSLSSQAQAPPIPVKKKMPFAAKALAAVGALLGMFWIIGAIADNSKQPSSTKPTTNAGASPHAITLVPTALTPEQKHIAAVKAHEQNVQQERQAREQKRAERREAERQARQQAEQAAEEARSEREAQEAQREAQEAQRADEEAYATIKAKVQHDYPNDYITQKGVYDMAVQAYQFMKTVPNDEVKAKVVSDYPDDYVTQKGVYEMAVQAKHDMQ